jgi:hypothetical protein
MTPPIFSLINVNLFGSILIFSIFFSFGCSEKNDTISNAEIMVPIDLSISKPGNYSDVFTSIEYILLDDLESSLLVNPYKIKSHNNRIYVQDIATENLHSFDKNGTHLFSIKSSGSGPGEFSKIEDYQIIGDSIFIFDRFLNKILVYDFDGKINKESKAPNYGTGFFKKEDKTLMYMDNRKDLSSYNFLLTNSKTNLEENIAIRKGFEKESQLLRNSFSVSPLDRSLYFNIPFSFEIAFFDQNLSFKRRLKFNLGRHEIEDEFRSSFFGSRDRSEYDLIRKERALVENLSGFFDLGKFYFLSLQQGGIKLHYVFLDREFNILYQSDKMFNDIDGMTIKGIPWTSTDDKIVILTNSINFYNSYVDAFSDKKFNIESNNVHGFFEKNKKKLIEDKTVLILLKVRNEINVR